MEKKFYSGFIKSIKLIKEESVNAPLLHVSLDTSQWFYLDTSKLSNTLVGTYFTSTGFVGCGIDVYEDGTIAFLPWSDVGGPESKSESRWIKKGDIIKLLQKDPLASWYTDNKNFYILPYYLIGKKIQILGNKYIETYKYFAKAPNDK